MGQVSAIVWILIALAFADVHSQGQDVTHLKRNTHISKAEIAKNPVLSLRGDLVHINSTSGAEGAIGNFLISYLQGHSFTSFKQNIPATNGNERFNILAHSGSTNHTRFLITSHIDTVPPFINYTFHPNNQTIYGRGTNDDKSAVVTQIFALKSLLESHELAPDDASLLFVVSEEFGDQGMKAFSQLNYTWDAIVFGEPTESKLVRGHKGYVGFNVTARGVSGYSSNPWLRKSAIDDEIKALDALRALDPKLPKSDKYSNGTLSIGTMNGGTVANVVSDFATAVLSVRLGGGTVEGVLSQVRETVEAVDSEIEVGFIGGIGPVPIDYDIEGFETKVENYGTHIPYLPKERKKYLYGPGSITTAHSADGFVYVSDLLEAVEGYKKFKGSQEKIILLVERST